MDVELSEPQAEFFSSEATAVAAVAGYRSGKTEASVIRLFTTMFENPGADMLYVAPTYPLVRDIFYPKVSKFLEGLGQKFRILTSDNVVKVYGYGTVYCRTMVHPDLLIGFEALNAHIDELDILKTPKALDVWRRVKARCSQKIDGKINQMFLTTTPEGFKATYEMFVKNPLPGSHLIKMSTYSNEHNLAPGYIEGLKEQYPAHLIGPYINGEFSNLVSMPVWVAYDRKLNDSTEVATINDPLIVGMDFNVGRGCAVVYVFRGENLHAVDEIYNSYDTPDTVRVLKERYPTHSIAVFPDASGNSRKSVNATTSDIAVLKAAGYAIKVRPSNPSIKGRVMSTNAKFCNGVGKRALFVNSKRCSNLVDALEQQVYDDNGLPEKGEGKFDDLTDAASYPINYLFPIKEHVTTSQSLEGIL